MKKFIIFVFVLMVGVIACSESAKSQYETKISINKEFIRVLDKIARTYKGYGWYYEYNDQGIVYYVTNSTPNTITIIHQYNEFPEDDIYEDTGDIEYIPGKGYIYYENGKPIIISEEEARKRGL